MAKQKESDTTLTIGQAAEQALAAPSPELVGGLTVAGDDSPPKLSELKLYQGSAEEAAQYGEHPRGCFLDTLEKVEIPNPVIAVLSARMMWVKFVEGQKWPVYVHYNKSDVPSEDFQEGSGKNGKGTAAQQQVLSIILVEGKPWPMLYRFKSTAFQALNKTIQPLEERRRMAGSIIGVYRLGSRDDVGQGKAYKRLTATPAGDLPESMRPLAIKVKAALVEWEAKAREAAEQREGDDGDNLPPI